MNQGRTVFSQLISFLPDREFRRCVERYQGDNHRENAVKTQIWIAVSVYVLVAIVLKRLGLRASLYQILQILSLTLFEKTPILCPLQAIDTDANSGENANQLILFDF